MRVLLCLEPALHDIEPSLSELLRLQETLPQNVGKLILSEEDVAAEIGVFYRRYFAESLAKDLETGVARDLYPYIEQNDDSRLEKARRFGPARYEEELEVLPTTAVLSGWCDSKGGPSTTSAMCLRST